MKTIITAALLLAPSLAAAEDLAAQVSREVNRSMTYRHEEQDEWDASCPPAGDCEDFALCKARKLLAAGMDPSRIAIMSLVDTWRDEGHAVLLVDGRVYDNRSPNDGRLLAKVKDYSPLYTCYMNGEVGVWVREGEIARRNNNAYPHCKYAVRELMKKD